VDNELKAHSAAKKRGSGPPSRGGQLPINAKRQKKNDKYGFGGKKRFAKSGDAVSSGDLSGFDAKRMKTGGKAKVAKTARLGKSRRKAAAGKR
jgi:rRNA-processing protein EBP2